MSLDEEVNDPLSEPLSQFTQRTCSSTLLQDRAVPCAARPAVTNIHCCFQLSKILTDVHYHGCLLLLTGSDSVSNAANQSDNGTAVAGECQSQDPSDEPSAAVGPITSYSSMDQQQCDSPAVSSDTSSRTSTPPLCTAAHSGTTTTVSAAPPCRHAVSGKSETAQIRPSPKTCNVTMSAAKRRRVGDESMSEGCRYNGQSAPRQEADIQTTHANDHHCMQFQVKKYCCKPAVTFNLDSFYCYKSYMNWYKDVLRLC